VITGEQLGVTEITDPTAEDGLVERVLAGEVVVVRGGLQRSGLLEAMVARSYAALRETEGEETVRAVEAVGFERIHEIVPIADIPAVTDRIYKSVTDAAAQDLRKLIPTIFKGVRDYYYEAAPNVRFHVPFDETRAHAALFNTFAEKRGQGKLSAHGPHRDSWLDCPDNGINIWFAIGRVRRGNGLTVYRDQYTGKQRYYAHGDIAEGEDLTQPLTFDLEPGDIILFHTDHLHGSELNRTRETRFVISYRMTFDRPHFPNGHYHTYCHSGLATGALKPLAAVPALLQPSFPRSLAERVLKKLRPAQADDHAPPANDAEPAPIAADSLAVGEVRAADPSTCVARLSEDRYVAFSRRCPHRGADLSNGFVADGEIVCPWHNLPFDPASGQSLCTTLKPLAIFEASVVNGMVEIGAEPKSARPRQARKVSAPAAE
jgi:nitrite reductase/ring-hydroxylating ferredoxin subunit